MLILKQCQFVALSGTTKNTWWVSPNLCQPCLLQQFNHEVQVIKRVLTHVWPDCIVQHFSIWAMHVKSWVESNRLLGWRLVLWRFHRISLNFAIKGGEVAGPIESLYSVYIANRNSSNSELKSARGQTLVALNIGVLRFKRCSSLHVPLQQRHCMLSVAEQFGQFRFCQFQSFPWMLSTQIIVEYATVLLYRLSLLLSLLFDLYFQHFHFAWLPVVTYLIICSIEIQAVQLVWWTMNFVYIEL